MEKITLAAKNYIQFSKRITRWVLIGWLVVVIAIICAAMFFDISSSETEIFLAVIQAATTIVCFIGVGYLGNSSAEKIVNAKYNVSKIMETTNKQEDG